MMIQNIKKDLLSLLKKQNDDFVKKYGKDALINKMKNVASGNTEESRRQAVESYKKRLRQKKKTSFKTVKKLLGKFKSG